MAGEAPAVVVVDSDSSVEEVSSASGAALSGKIRSYSDIISVSTMEQIPPATLLRPSQVFSIRSSSPASVEEIIHTEVPSSNGEYGGVSLEKLSSDVFSGSSVEEITLDSSSGPNRENLAYEVIHKKRNIEEICICCGSLETHTQHPLFHGGICDPCTERFLERFFLCDDDGFQADCAICCWGESLVMCDEPNCIRCICTKCLDTLVRRGIAEEIKEINHWTCFLCLPLDVYGVLKKRKKWRTGLKRFYDQYSLCQIYQPLSAVERKPINVLSIFENIKQELKSLRFLGANMDNGRLKYLDDVTDVVRTHIEEWGPFDLIFGSTPALANSYEHPSAWYMYQYVRILQYSRPPERSRPFFWMFIDNLVLEEETRDAACRFLKTEAVVRYKLQNGAIKNVVHIWSNIPSVNSKYSASSLCVDLFLLAKDICRTRIFSERPATLIKEFLVPLKDYFETFK